MASVTGPGRTIPSAAGVSTSPPARHDRSRRFAIGGVAACTAIALGLRVLQARQDLFADELSTFWIVTTRPPGEVISTVASNAEISPPLSFLVAWATTRLGVSPGWLRAGSVLSGTLTVPLLYAVGARAVSRAAGLVAAAVAALAPFMVYYSGEGRGYALLMALVLLSTASLLRVAERGGPGAWLAYAFAVCAAVYTHYTCIFVLGAQAAWLWWAHPETRRTSLLVHAAAAAAYLPWIPGFVADLRSPTLLILSSMQPFDLRHATLALSHAGVGHPYPDLAAIDAVPGPLALALLALGLALSLVGIARQRRRPPASSAARRLDRNLVLVVALALATPVGAALASLLGDAQVYAARNLAASWPGFALALGALTVAAGPRLRFLTSALVVASFAVGAAKLLEPRFERPHVSAAAAWVEALAAPGDVVIDETAQMSPGPLSHLDPVIRGELRLVRSNSPAVRDHPFTVFDPEVPPDDAARLARDAARGGRIFVVSFLEREKRPAIPQGYRLREEKRWTGLLTVVVRCYEPEAPASSPG